MEKGITEQDILAAFEKAGLNPADYPGSEEFTSAFREALTRTMSQEAGISQDQRQAEQAGQIDGEVRARMEGKNTHEKALILLERRQQIEQARQAATLTDDQVKQATLKAISQVADQFKAERRKIKQAALMEQYNAEIQKLVSGPYYPSRIDRITEIKQKYRSKGLTGI